MPIKRLSTTAWVLIVALAACTGNDSASNAQSDPVATANPTQQRIVNRERSSIRSFLKTLSGITGSSIDGDTLTVKVSDAYFVMSDEGKNALQQVLVTEWNLAYIRAHHVKSVETHININGSEGTVWSD